MVSQPGQGPIPPGSAHYKVEKDVSMRHSEDRAKPSKIKAEYIWLTLRTPLPPDQHHISDVAKWR